MKIKLPSIQHNKAGFESLVDLYAQTYQYRFESIEVELGKWFDADMCAPFGAVLYKLGKNAHTLLLNTPIPQVEKILAMNGFLSYY